MTTPTNTPDTAPHTWTLSAHEWAATRDKIAKINDRAAKRGFTGRLDATAEKVEHTRTNNLGFEITEIWYHVTITGTAPCYNGWTFLAVLEWDPSAGLIVSTAPGVDTVDRAGLREGWCDHCRTRRHRNRTYLVANEAGEQRQVGSTCIRDFLGWDGKPVFISVSEIGDDIDDLAYDYAGGRYAREWSTETVLAIAWASIQAHGYRPASGFDYPTKNIVRDVLDPRDSEDREVAEALRPYVEQARPMADKIRRWVVDEMTGNTEYVRNLKALAAADAVTDRRIGLLASAPQAWAKQQERDLIRRREAEQLNNTWAGEVGERIEVTVQLKAARYTEGDWGTTAIYTLVGDDGRVYKWFSSNHALDGDTADGVRFRIRGTVKKHGEWQGTKETVLTRCKVLEELPVAA